MKIEKNFKFLSIYACLLLVGSALFFSCEEEEPEIYDGMTFVSFNEQAATLNVNENSGSRAVEIGITQAFDADVIVTLQVTDITAEESVDYLLSSNTVTIPAGEYIGEFSIDPIDNDAFNESKSFLLEIVDVSISNVSIGHANEASFMKNVIIVNEDCPTQSNIWWGPLVVEDVGYPNIPGVVGAANSNGDCDVLNVVGDLGGFNTTPAAGFNFFFTPDFPGATSGTIDVPSQTYCVGCSAGLNVNYIANGTYDETTQTIVVFYTVQRTDGAGYTGTNIITPQ